MLALLSSMPFESEKILSCMKNVRKIRVTGRIVYRGKVAGINCLIVNTGIGKVNAAHSATCILEKFSVKKVINMGVAGAYPDSGLGIGDVAIASKEIYGDEGVVDSAGWGSLKRIGIPLLQRGKKKYFNEFPLDNSILKNIDKLVMGIKFGSFVTVSASTGTQKRARELEKRFNAICENMEGAAIAHVCMIYKVPMAEIRGISNMVGIRDRRKWNLKLASENCQHAVLNVMKSLF